MRIDRSPRARTASFAVSIVIATGAVLMLAPFYWLIVASTHRTRDIFSNPPNLVPGDQLWVNLTNLFVGEGFGQAVLNSTLVAAIYALLGGLVVDVPAARVDVILHDLPQRFQRTIKALRRGDGHTRIAIAMLNQDRRLDAIDEGDR